MLFCAFGSSDGAKVKRLFRWRAPLHLPLGFAVRKEDGAGTNRLWPIVPEFPKFAYAVALRGRPGLRFTGTGGGAATTLLLAFALALRLVPLVGSTVANSIVSTITDFAAIISMTLTLPGSGAITSVVSVTASIAAALAGAAAVGFFRSPNPMFFSRRVNQSS
jgi:hypothetical protein